MANTLQVKRGAKTSLPTLNSGEFGFCTDTYEAFIGDGAANHQLLLYDDFDANTILAATTNNTPAALTIAASTFVGRKAAGNISAMSASEARTILNVEDGADVTDATNVDAAGAVMESDYNATSFLYAITNNTPQNKTPAEVMDILSGQSSADFSMGTNKITALVDPTNDQDAATKNYIDESLENFELDGNDDIQPTLITEAFETDGDGNYMPTKYMFVSNDYYDLDGNDDIQPKAG